MGGGGAVSQPGDSTWIHTFYDGHFWRRPGADFLARASAVQEVSEPGLYTWESGPKLVTDVRLWLRAPQRNFGWILLGDETTPQNVKRFASRESSDPSHWPLLNIVYELPGN